MRTRVAVAESGKLEVEGEDEEGRLDVLPELGAGVVFAHRYVAVAEVHSRCEAQVEVGAEAVVNQSVYAKARLERGLVNEPRFSVFSDEAVVCKSEILCVEADREAEVPPAQVGIGAVHQLVVEVLS